MWINKTDYEILKRRADYCVKYELENKNLNKAVDYMSEMIHKINGELYEIKKDLKYYLDTNEEKGVVYIPKFVIEKIIYDR